MESGDCKPTADGRCCLGLEGSTLCDVNHLCFLLLFILTFSFAHQKGDVVFSTIIHFDL